MRKSIWCGITIGTGAGAITTSAAIIILAGSIVTIVHRGCGRIIMGRDGTMFLATVTIIGGRNNDKRAPMAPFFAFGA
ncbi:MAG: hypothetical protein BGP07_04175 [Rhizobiales bacterium 63-22]|nr:MAG: hypothetical protein BGP07_04175 [Rhizobiales bacterium 63-22]